MQDKKTRSLISIIVFLLITNIILLCFFIFDRNGNLNSHSGNLNMVGTFLKEQIGFNEQQMDAYQKLRKNDFEHARPLFEKMRSAKDSFYQNIYKSNVPDFSLQMSAKNIGEREVAIDLQMLQHFKNLRSLCTLQQLPKFDSLFRNIAQKITSGRFKNNNHH